MSKEIYNNFKVDTWYKGFIYLGGVITVGGFFYPVQIFDNQNVTLFGLGFFLYGLGIWSKQRGYIFDANGKEIKYKKSLITHLKLIMQLALTLIGILLIFYSTYEIIKHYIA